MGRSLFQVALRHIEGPRTLGGWAWELDDPHFLPHFGDRGCGIYTQPGQRVGRLLRAGGRPIRFGVGPANLR